MSKVNAGPAGRRKNHRQPSLQGITMTLQNVFQKSENLAVAVIFTLFIISHFGLLYLLHAI